MGLKSQDSGTRAQPYRKTYGKHSVGKRIALLPLLILITSSIPATTRAGIVSDFFAGLWGTKDAMASASVAVGNVQTMPLLRPAKNIDPTPGTGGGDIVIVDSSAVVPDEGPSGTIAEIERPKNVTITNYVVRSGDTLSEIAQMYGVTPNTILWANNLPRGSQLKAGETLLILPITGLPYAVQKGDTIASIAKKYGAQEVDITSYNGIDERGLTVGQRIIIPNGELPEILPAKVAKRGSSVHVASSNEPAHDVGPRGTSAQIGYYMRPIEGGVETQGVHGYNAVDLAAPVGTPIRAAASGDVIVAREGGWNGGYGSYVVIQHDNGSQTLYGHASAVLVSDGDHVVQGQIIAHVGSTGRSTGAHVHFEIRDGIRNPF